MTKRRKIFICISSLLISVSVVNMNPQNIVADQKEVFSKNIDIKKITSYPEIYDEDTDEGVSFRAHINPPVNLASENKEMQVTYKTINFDVALKELFSDVGKIKKEETILQPENSLYQSAYGENDEVLSNSIGMFRMEKTHWKKVRDAIEISEKDLGYNADMYREPHEFSFGTADEVWEKLKIILQKLGVMTPLKPTKFYMDYQTMQKEDEKSINKNEDSAEESKKVWSEADNGYYISAVQCVDGNTVFANTYFGNGIEGKEDTANVLAYIDKDGIQMLEITRIIDQISETGKVWEMLSLKKIVDAVKKKFAMVITEAKIEVEEFQFSYMTEAISDTTYCLIPVWFCNYKQIEKDGSSRMCQMIINAETGEEVLYELY